MQWCGSDWLYSDLRYLMNQDLGQWNHLISFKHLLTVEINFLFSKLNINLRVQLLSGECRRWCPPKVCSSGRFSSVSVLNGPSFLPLDPYTRTQMNLDPHLIRPTTMWKRKEQKKVHFFWVLEIKGLFSTENIYPWINSKYISLLLWPVRECQQMHSFCSVAKSDADPV